MKITLALICFFAATSALAQNAGVGGVLSNEPAFVEFSSHPTHAMQSNMADVQNVLERSTNILATGERPLWEVAPKEPTPVPLGDVARAYRQERLTDGKKAVVHWENQ